MELSAYLAILWQRKWIIAMTAMATVAVAIVGALIIAPTHEAAITLRVTTATKGQSDFEDVLYAERLMNTYTKMATSESTLNELAHRLGLDALPQVEAVSLKDAGVMQIRVKDRDPALAAKVANALGELVIAQEKSNRRVRHNTLRIIAPATLRDAPNEWNTGLHIALEFVVGVAGGLGLALLLADIDTTLATLEQIEAVTELAILGEFVALRKRRRTCNASSPLLNLTSLENGTLRRLWANLSVLCRQSSLQTLLVTSALPGDGKSTTVLNLALAAAQSGQRVVVVDGNLYLPTIHRLFDLPNGVGLGNVLWQEVSLTEAMQDSSISGVQVLTSGSRLFNPAELVGSREMMALIKALSQGFDLVLIDTPALLPVIDAAILASLVDGVLLVVSLGRSRREDVETTCKQLVAGRAQLIGAIANRARLGRPRLKRRYRQTAVRDWAGSTTI